ncbi:hypothetical protein OQ496_09245 [Acetobacter suratthaniensis]|uniref:Uncharacterized protein n=1 Tax=Acetobacter suratthaniensis TaxID=1502841 RepID=A0ABS3LMC7_9PROT|nr:hypothetical protein [Acetobacter suratthaniensis]MBO1328514.1 hypothetical protein [Acetobacter suratthaniensis]MCX2566643.1 hypothetical protein [Acetobacter suratthaniensis]
MGRAPKDHAANPSAAAAASEEEISQLVAAVEEATIIPQELGAGIVLPGTDLRADGGTPVKIDPDRLVWLFTGPMGYVPRGSLIIVCRAPGFRRAGIEHPPVAVYPFDHFTTEQIRSMEEEPMLQLIGVGF